MEILNTFIGTLSEKNWNVEAFYKRLIAFDLSIGSEILTSDINADMLNEAITVMQRLDLQHSTIAAAYRLDRNDLWPDMFIEGTKDLNLEEYFQTWAQQSEPMTEKTLQPYSEEVVILKTHIAGCEITIECPNVDQYIITAESILAATESSLATATLYHGIATEPQVKIVINPESKQHSAIITHKVVSDSELVISVSVSKFNPFSIDPSMQEEIADSIMHICVSILAHIMVFKDTKDTLDKLLRSERAFVRSIGYTSSFIRMGNVVGYKPKYRLRDWALKTDKHADGGLVIKSPLKNDTTIQTNDLPDIQKVSHRDITTASIIRLPLWDKAKWRGVMYGISPENTNPPILALLFEDADSGRRIFEAWNNQFGHVDKEEAIRIAIIKGIDTNFPLHYRVGVSRDMEKIASPGKIIGVATRICTMTPTSSENLDRFIAAYKKQGSFGFTFAILGIDGYPHIQTQNIILKKNVQIREATEVGDNDPDIVLLRERKTNKERK